MQLQVLQDRLDAFEQASELQSVPCGDDIRILLFARCDREKEDWFRRFTSASIGSIVDQELQFPDMVMVYEDDVAAAVKAATLANQERDSFESIDGEGVASNVVPVKSDVDSDDGGKHMRPDSAFEGLLLTSCAARGPADYVKFMTRFQVSIDDGVFATFCPFVFCLFCILFYFHLFILNRKLVPLSLYQLFAPIQPSHRTRKYVFFMI